MTHRTFKELGGHLANGWGYDDEGELDAKIRKMPSDQRTYCLLAAVVGELRKVSAEISSLRYEVRSQHRKDEPKPPETPDVVADGMLQWACRAMGDTLIADHDQSELSPRARKALKRCGASMMSQVVPERFVGLKNCGEVTISEIVSWAETARSR